MKKLKLVVKHELTKFLHDSKTILTFEPKTLDNEEIFTTFNNENFIKSGIFLTSDEIIELKLKYTKSDINDFVVDGERLLTVDSQGVELLIPIVDGIIIRETVDKTMCQIEILNEDVYIHNDYHELSVVSPIVDFELHKKELLEQSTMELEMAENLKEFEDENGAKFLEAMKEFRKHVEKSKSFEELAQNKDTLIINIDGVWYKCIVFLLDGVYLNGEFKHDDIVESYMNDCIFSNECDHDDLAEFQEFIFKNRDILKFVKKNDYYKEDENGLV